MNRPVGDGGGPGGEQAAVGLHLEPGQQEHQRQVQHRDALGRAINRQCALHTVQCSV
jgi:hypothetical protein